MRISDWSSDVCSSDLRSPRSLGAQIPDRAIDGVARRPGGGAVVDSVPLLASRQRREQGFDQRVHAVDALAEIGRRAGFAPADRPLFLERHHRQRRSEEHTSELQSLMRISYAVFCLKKKKK